MKQDLRRDAIDGTGSVQQPPDYSHRALERLLKNAELKRGKCQQLYFGSSLHSTYHVMDIAYTAKQISNAFVVQCWQAVYAHLRLSDFNLFYSMQQQRPCSAELVQCKTIRTGQDIRPVGIHIC